MACRWTLSILVVFWAYANCQISKENLVAISQKARKLPYDTCGQSDIFKDKLNSGSAAALGAYPWMAALGYNKRKLGSKVLWIAGGSLITDQYVLTAARVLAPSLIYNLVLVRLGDLNLEDNVTDGASPVDMKVEKTILHPGYNSTRKFNDIGLIKLASKVQFDYFKKPICLPSPEFNDISFVGRSTIIIGWGINAQGHQSAPLAETSVDIQDFDKCKTNYEKSFPQQTHMDERVFCASSPGRDSCSGDTGGPLMMYRRYRGKSRMFVMGIVSYGHLCGLEKYPGVYTNVSSFMYWIVDNLEL